MHVTPHNTINYNTYDYACYIIGSTDAVVFLLALIQVVRIILNEREQERFKVRINNAQRTQLIHAFRKPQSIPQT
jgi:hypothetical protein